MEYQKTDLPELRKSNPGEPSATASSSEADSKTIHLQGANTSMARSKTLPPPPDWAICQALNLPEVEVSWLAGDGSDRCYYRIKGSSSKKTYVLMQLSGDDALQLQQDGYEWVKIGRLLHDHGISAPQTIATMPNFAALIIEDYGDLMMETQVLKALEENRSEKAFHIYRQAFQILGRFLQITDAGSSHWRDRSFDAQRLNWELHFFREQYLESVLNWELSSEELAAFTKDAYAISHFLAEASQYFVHRDFHSRNAMVRDLDLAVIDFQDARLGPPTYDLVSLCFDSYVPLKPEERRALLQEGLVVLNEHVPALSLETLQAEWGPMLLQRQLKALGSFGFLTNKKNRGNYLKYVEPALSTLSANNVADDRWPFISGNLLQGIRQRLRVAGGKS